MGRRPLPSAARVRSGAHSARHQDSRNDLTPCRMAWHFVSAGAHAPHSDQTLGPTPTRGRRTPLGAYPPSLPCAPPKTSSGTNRRTMLSRRVINARQILCNWRCERFEGQRFSEQNLL